MVKGFNLASAKYALFFFLLIVTFGGFAQATDYYVDNQNASANDANPGTQALPFRTIQKCANVAIAGDTCYVKPGTYDEHVQTTKSGTASNPSACIPTSGTYPNYTINPPCQAQRITFKAQGKVTMKGFNIKNSFITIEGFDITNYGGKYYGHINIFPGGDYCQILNNTIRDGIDGVHGIYIRDSPQAKFSYIKGNTLKNLNNMFLTIDGERNLIEENVFEYQNSMDYVRFFGHDNFFRRNIFRLGVAKPGAGNHPDFLQTFGVPTGESYNQVFEENWVENLESQFGQINSGDGTIAVGRGTLFDNVRDLTFRRNVFFNISGNANISVPGAHFLNNTFYRLAYTQAGIGFGGSLTRGDSSRALLKNNVFLEGSYNGEKNSIIGFYGVSGASLTEEVIAIHITKEGLTDYPIAKALFEDLWTGYLDANNYVTFRFEALPDYSKLVVPQNYAPYKEQIYETLRNAMTNDTNLSDKNFSFLPTALSKGSLITALKTGYINGNGNLLQKGLEVNNISDFSVSQNSLPYKDILFEYLIRTKELDASIRNTFYANYNYVAGAQSLGFPEKRSSDCNYSNTFTLYNFCETNGINGGDPGFLNLSDPDGPDDTPFTLDDGLKPRPDSNLCGKGEGGTDIGALSCNPDEVFPGQSYTPTYTLTVQKQGTGAGDVTGTGIDCGQDCSETMSQGTQITLTALPGLNSNFTGWSGAGCSGTGPCTITMNSNFTITANFDSSTYPECVAPPLGGSVTYSLPVNCVFYGSLGDASSLVKVSGKSKVSIFDAVAFTEFNSRSFSSSPYKVDDLDLKWMNGDYDAVPIGNNENLDIVSLVSDYNFYISVPAGNTSPMILSITPVVEGHHPADTSKNFVIEGGEWLVYAICYRNSALELCANFTGGITLFQLLNAAVIFKSPNSAYNYTPTGCNQTQPHTCWTIKN